MSWRDDAPFGRKPSKTIPSEDDLRKKALESVKRRKIGDSNQPSEQDGIGGVTDAHKEKAFDVLGGIFRSRTASQDEKKSKPSREKPDLGPTSSSPSKPKRPRSPLQLFSSREKHLSKRNSSSRDEGGRSHVRRDDQPSSHSSRRRDSKEYSKHRPSPEMSHRSSSHHKPGRHSASRSSTSPSEPLSKRPRHDDHDDSSTDSKIDTKMDVSRTIASIMQDSSAGLTITPSEPKKDAADTDSHSPQSNQSHQSHQSHPVANELASTREEGEVDDTEESAAVQPDRTTVTAQAEDALVADLIRDVMADDDDDDVDSEISVVSDNDVSPAEEVKEPAREMDPNSAASGENESGMDPSQETAAAEDGHDGDGVSADKEKDLSESEEKVISPRFHHKGGRWGSLDELESDSDVSDVNLNQSLEEDDQGMAIEESKKQGLSVHTRWLHGCRHADVAFEKLNSIDEGMYGIVFRAKDKETGEIVALKKLKLIDKLVQHEGFPLTALREMNLLLQMDHPNIIGVKEVVMADQETIIMVMEYCDHDLKSIQEALEHPFRISEVKCLLIQLLRGVNYMHKNWILHRDIKPSNLLLTLGGELKICDMGLARGFGDPVRPYTPYDRVVTLWYRSPELLFGVDKYSTAIDMWSVGCIFAELLNRQPLFDAKNEVEQYKKIASILGPPTPETYPDLDRVPNPYKLVFKPPSGKSKNILREKFPRMSFSGGITLSDVGFDLLQRMLCYDPEKRISAEEALRHPFFSEAPIACHHSQVTQPESTHLVSRRHRKIKKTQTEALLNQLLADDMERYERVNKNRDRRY